MSGGGTCTPPAGAAVPIRENKDYGIAGPLISVTTPVVIAGT